LGHAYQLLLSAWSDVEEGRLSAAADHWRSIFEAPDYLLAVWWDEGFAKDWPKPSRENQKATRAMGIVKNELNARQSGLGDARHANRKEYRQDMHQFSHVSAGAAGLNFMRSGAGTFFMPEGSNSADNVLTALYLVQLSREVLSALRLTIDEFMPDAWQERLRAANDAVLAYAKGINDAMGGPLPKGA
jgi:hypothetical protein